MAQSLVASHSLSRDLRRLDEASTPQLLHSLHSESKNSVLSLAVSDAYIFSGSQNFEITVWERSSLKQKDTLKGHTGSVLALVYAKEKEWLISSSGDSTVRVWSGVSLTPVYIIEPYLFTEAGDLFSLAWSPSLQTVYVGCQNTSLQWYTFAPATPDGTATPSGRSSTPRKAHKFFDSYPQSERRPADLYANNTPSGSRDVSPDGIKAGKVARLSIPPENVIDSAHYGYIYAMAFVEVGKQMITGGGDESIKIWDCTNAVPNLVAMLECCYGAVYAIVSQRDTIYAGCQDGHVKVIDLETKTLVRSVIVQEGIDVLAMSLIGSDLYTCCADGRVQRYSSSFDCTASWLAHDGIILSSIITPAEGRELRKCRLITGGNDNSIKVWDIVPPQDRLASPELRANSVEEKDFKADHSDTLTYALSQFISFPSVSENSSNREDCRQAAIWLKKCLSQLGAAGSTLLSAGEGINPLVLATFTGSQVPASGKRPRVLFYGHYDVIPAPDYGWDSPPFTLTGRNGYLYGRGVTDDKGPILAVACAAAALLYRRALGVDLVFLIEGEEEEGSVRFAETVRANKDAIGHIDAIFVSNSTWITDEHPCITYGLRGVVHCAIEISSDHPDLHSGVEGGAVAEPMLDMINLLSTLTDCEKRVKIPCFYDHVRKQSDYEKELYATLAQITNKPASSLSSRWREPSLTVHSVEISGPSNSTVIPGRVKAQVSLRIVPDQDLDTIVESMCTFLHASFDKLRTPNKLTLSLDHKADWWLGDLDDPWFKSLESAIQDVWGVAPLRIREGGSIPSLPFLEKEFGCHALHLPLGQSSDQAHLPNERISLTNLHSGRAVVEKFLLKMAAVSS